MTELYLRKSNTKCVVCDQAIYRRPVVIKRSKGKVYCSQKCYGLGSRREIPCITCGNLILSGLNKKTCSRKCSNINRAGIKYNIGRPYDNAKNFKNIKSALFEKRGAKCERCDYNKREILEVHHKNRNRKDNSDSNLEIICPNCHAEEHYLKK